MELVRSGGDGDGEAGGLGRQVMICPVGRPIR